MIKVKKHTEGDSRVATELPTVSEFDAANNDHIQDVKNAIEWFARSLTEWTRDHDWTKSEEPYRSMFYRDLCAAIEGKKDFMNGEWAHLHYYVKEKHHLRQHCQDNVNLFDVIEMICDCVVAGMARTGNVYDVDIPTEVLTKAVTNTVEMLKNNIEIEPQDPPISTDEAEMLRWDADPLG